MIGYHALHHIRRRHTPGQRVESRCQLLVAPGDDDRPMTERRPAGRVLARGRAALGHRAVVVAGSHEELAPA
ncbi:hypothetical protein, partial [Streptomyces poriferorum]|uniref:hypothetical protein n=1 Tax=Streptomyces poriferorum TaxID=2798799 RepID=UPI001F2A41E7